MLGKIEKTVDCWFLIAISFLFFLLRLPSLFEPYWYGDEGIYQVVGMGINHGRLLYRDIWDNKPPLLYMLYAFFSSDQFTIRLVSLFFGLASVFIFYLLARKLYNSQPTEKKTALWTTGIFAVFFGLPLLEGNIANAENFMLLPILLGGLLIFNQATTQDKKISFYPSSFILHPFIAGFLLGLAFLFKVVAVFDFAAFFLFLGFVTIERKINIQTLLPKLVPLCIAFALPALVTIAFFLTKGAFFDFINAALKQNVGYVGYGNTLLFPQGLLFLKLLLLAIVTSIFFLKRNVLGHNRLFIFLWFSFAVFNAFFSQRPYTHYLLVLLPSFVYMLGLLFWNGNTKSYQKGIVLLFFVLSILILKNFTFYGKTFLYYQNFIAFLTNSKSVSDYQSFFDKNTPSDYAVAAFIKTHIKKGDQLFVWGDSAQIYTLTNTLPPGRYAVAYHITASKNSVAETQMVLDRTKPKYLVVSSKSLIPFRLYGYAERILLYNAIIYERIY